MTLVKKKKIKKSVSKGVAYVKSTFNNTIVTITDDQGNVLAQSSAGHAGFKGSKKGTPFAAQLAGEKAATKAIEYSMDKVDILVNGPGPGRETAVRAIQAAGIEVMSIKDITPMPHNGCRPRKRRRV